MELLKIENTKSMMEEGGSYRLHQEEILRAEKKRGGGGCHSPSEGKGPEGRKMHNAGERKTMTFDIGRELDEKERCLLFTC